MDKSWLIEKYYDVNSEHEWRRMDRHRTEFAVTLKAMREFLPAPPARILDCGGGPGRYAIELARWGYQVTLYDLSQANLLLAREKAQAAGVELHAYEQGNALDLARFEDSSFDAVLLLGPLYHLLEEAGRLQALAEAHRVLKPGGVLFASFISRYAAHRDLAYNDPSRLYHDQEISNRILEEGCLYPQKEDGTEFVAYFAHPNEVMPLVEKPGLELCVLLGVEGLVTTIENKVNALSGAEWQAWADLNYKIARDPSILGCVEHLLAVAFKPRWREVLKEIAFRLNQVGIVYTVVGGASITLQGAGLPVKDIDIETTAEDAYRFQELFQEKLVEPVTFSEGPGVRSHFGRFDFDGVQVEVMGDSHRREGDGWKSTWARTHRIVHLEGEPVRVSWLEEETLAYIRRGRLERAGICLALCDQTKMLLLLRGEVQAGVL